MPKQRTLPAEAGTKNLDPFPGKIAVMIKAFVDRVENDRAVIITSDEAALQFDLPVGLLPANSAPGDHLTIVIERAPDETAATMQTIQQLKSELIQTTDPEQLDFKL